MKESQSDQSHSNESAIHSAILIDQVVDQIVSQQQAGQKPIIEEFINRYPQLQNEIREVWSVLAMLDCFSPDPSVFGQLKSQNTGSNMMPVNSQLPDEGEPTIEQSKLWQAGIKDSFIGRYQIQKQLGRGGFGTVYLASDTELDRLVAIKLPHHDRMASGSAKRSYLLEARTLAKLDHPNIVPVFDFGLMTDGRCFVVSKFVDGQDLAQLLRSKRISPQESVSFVQTVAEALHYVHQARVVHRDIKPPNILIGNDGRIYVADFGLALAESASDEPGTLLGTPGYMSPEQIRREGHRVDGRTDQFSLGVVMYELLTGERPFRGGDSSDIMQKIIVLDPKPPSQICKTVPRELSRICMKLLSKLASNRYPSMMELAKELRDWKDIESLNEQLRNDSPEPDAIAATKSLVSTPKSIAPHNTLVIPRGIRAFSRKDSYFFVDLVPGIRDRDGIPESLSHWRNWICSPDYSPEWHRIGVISGPTGCGKSSLVRAGLIPLLGPEVTTVILEATPELTEKHLLSQLEHCGILTAARTLPEKVMEIRRGGGMSSDKKLLIIIDQFEQWLHGNPESSETDLLQALRQCDGKRVQCLLLIRDDFWLALSRFMKAVETPLQLGRNAVMVDLFDQKHAKHVLSEFGRGYGALPPKPNPLTSDQEKFIDRAVGTLTIENKIIPVQLSLFAEMVKAREWKLDTLHRLGGSVGIGSQFLNESFSVTYAPANQRVHEEAAKSVLKSMLPKAGTEIKTCRRSFDEIFASSGYVDRDAFHSLLNLLESELKLITATNSLDRSRTDSGSSSSDPVTYQLSHDFLVPSIRDWLSSSKQMTWRSRMEQTIVQQSEYWSQNHQRRFLPNFGEWFLSLFLIRRNRLGVAESEMMKARDRLSMMQIVFAALVLTAFTWLTHSVLKSFNLDKLISQLQVVEASQVADVLGQIEGYDEQGRTVLRETLAKTQPGTREAFLLQLGLVTEQPELKFDVLDYSLNQADLNEVKLATSKLRSYAPEITGECWKVIEAADVEISNESPQQQVVSNRTHLHALMLLAGLEVKPDTSRANGRSPQPNSPSEQWRKFAATLTRITIRASAYNPNQYGQILESLQPISEYLVDVLAESVGQTLNDNLSFSALSLLRDFTQHDPSLQTRLCLHASSWQRPYITPAVNRLDLQVLRSELEQPGNSVSGNENDPKKAALRQAMAATLLLKASENNPKLWTIFQRSTDLTSRTYAIQLMRELSIPTSTLERQISVESDAGILAAILQILGGIDADGESISDACKSQVALLYRDHPDAGVHSSALWCLTKWNDLDTINQISQSSPKQNQEKPTEDKNWFITPSGHLMIKITSNQPTGQKFAIAAHEVTLDQFKLFTPGRYFPEEFSPAGDCPASIIKWRDAAAYCNWLSEQEGLKPFYPKDSEQLSSWQPTPQDLEGTGYRLPQENEWEIAARAGATTDRPFGIDSQMIVHYDWCSENQYDFAAKHRPQLKILYADPVTVRSKPVGQLLPNEYGVFDILGNVAEWCNDLNPTNLERAVRGGATGGAIRYLDVHHIGTVQPNQEYNSNGFRIARTLK